MRCLMTSIYLELETKPLRRPFRAFCNLDLEPRAQALGTSTVTREAPKGRCSWSRHQRRLMTSIYLELRSNSLRRPFRAFRNLDLEPRACALGCPAGPLRGPWFRARN